MSIDNILFIGLIIVLAGLSLVFRKRLAIQKIVGPFIYIALYRSQVGVAAMKNIADRFKKQLSAAESFVIGIGFLGMALVSFEILAGLYALIMNPANTAGVALVLPFKAKGIFYVPFVYWIASIFFVVVIHEGAHGIYSALHKVKIKSSGLAALAILVPIVPAAFVEPDENKLRRKPAKAQLGVFAAGPVSNIIAAFLLAVIIINITTPLVDRTYQKDGLTIDRLAEDKTLPVQSSGLSAGMIVSAIDGKEFKDLAGFQETFKTKKPGDNVELTTDKGKFTTIVGENSDKKGTPYLGVFFLQAKHKIINAWWTTPLELLNELLAWMMAMSLGVGLFNLLPLGIVDGGRMLHTVLHRYLRENHANATWAAISGMFFCAVLGSMIISAMK